MAIAKGDILEAIAVKDRYGRRMLQRFQRLFQIPMFHFYHPEAAPQVPSESGHIVQ